MLIQNKTIYTRDRLIRYQDYVAFSKKKFWALLIICGLVEALCAVVAYIGDFYDNIYTFALIILGVLILTSVFMFFVLPRIAIKKSPILNTEIEYLFEDEQFTAKRETQGAKDESTLNYSMLVKVAKNKNDLYLFVAINRCHIVDLSELSQQELESLKQALESALGAKKVKFN